MAQRSNRQKRKKRQARTRARRRGGPGEGRRARPSGEARRRSRHVLALGGEEPGGARRARPARARASGRCAVTIGAIVVGRARRQSADPATSPASRSAARPPADRELHLLRDPAAGDGVGHVERCATGPCSASRRCSRWSILVVALALMTARERVRRCSSAWRSSSPRARCSGSWSRRSRGSRCRSGTRERRRALLDRPARPLRRPGRDAAPEQRRVPALLRDRADRVHRARCSRSTRRASASEFGFIFAECHINYRAPGHYHDDIRTYVWVDRDASARASARRLRDGRRGDDRRRSPRATAGWSATTTSRAGASHSGEMANALRGRTAACRTRT